MVSHRIQECTSSVSESAKEQKILLLRYVVCCCTITQAGSVTAEGFELKAIFFFVIQARINSFFTRPGLILGQFQEPAPIPGVRDVIPPRNIYAARKNCRVTVANHKYKEKVWGFIKADTREFTPCYHHNFAIVIPLACRAIYRSTSILESHF